MGRLFFFTVTLSGLRAAAEVGSFIKPNGPLGSGPGPLMAMGLIPMGPRALGPNGPRPRGLGGVSRWEEGRGLGGVGGE